MVSTALLYSLTGGVSSLCTQLGMFTARAALVAVHFVATAPKLSLLELAASSGSAQQEQLAAPTVCAAGGQGPVYYQRTVSQRVAKPRSMRRVWTSTPVH